MNTDYSSKGIIEFDNELSTAHASVVLTGNSLTIPQITHIASDKSTVKITDDHDIIHRMEKSYDSMMHDIRVGTPVYGSNSAFGGQAARVLNEGDEAKRIRNGRKLSEGLVFLDVSVGPTLPSHIVRAAMAIRLNMLLKGVSAVRYSTVEVLAKMLNKGIIPVVHEYGGIGASGDLAHNQRIVSAARGLPGTFVMTQDGKVKPARQALEDAHIPLLQLDPKEGLALVNGDNFSTAFAVDVTTTLTSYLLINVVVSAMTVEVLKGTNRMFHPMLAEVRPHPGQRQAADIYRYLLAGSKLAFQELSGPVPRAPGIKVQDGYSLRCLSQYDGVIIETIGQALQSITINANSASDNPLWVPDEFATEGEKPWQWVSGGNFLAMYMAETLDRLRKATTQLVKQNDRHLARMIDETENNGIPANLSDPKRSITQCSFKGMQIQSGMFEIYSMVLANPVTTLFGTHEERNQDITSHAMTSGILARKNLEILKYSLATNLLAVAQGIDLRGGGQVLSPKTRPVYEYIRSLSDMVEEERPLHTDIEKVAEKIADGSLNTVLRDRVFFKL